MKSILTNSKKHMRRGFSLVESLVAISILAMTVVAPLLIASNALNAAYYSKDRLTAIALAQDAIEYMRSSRDNARLQGAAWIAGLDNCRVDPNNGLDYGCIIDTVATANQIQKSYGGSPTAGPLKRDNVTGLYGYNAAWPDSGFTRRAVMTELTVGQEAKIAVTVTWQVNASVLKNVTVVENITNW
jgi:prepilin-type N-terminal cleavage/methylation domain-containing protein